jgi:hypothetical protein
MGNIAEQKNNLIQLISAIDNPRVLDWLEKELRQQQSEKNGASFSEQEVDDEKSEYETLKAKLLGKPPGKKLDPEAIKREQGWKGQHDEAEIMRLIREINVKEPIELLLSQLSK